MTMTSEPVFAPARLALLLQHFSEINDDRESWRVAYPLKEVLLLVSCATIANCDDFEAIVSWGEHLWVANWQIWHESPLWCSLVQIGRQDSFQLMRDLLLLAIHLLVTLTKLLGLGGARQVVAESLLLKHQLLVSNRSRQRAPNLTMLDRLVLGLTTRFVSPHRIPKLSAIIKPATLFKFHRALVHRPSKIPSAVLLFPSEAKARTERPFHTTHRGHRRDEAPQSKVRLCPHCPANQSRFWLQNRQRCRASRACLTLSTPAGRRWSV